MINNNTNDFARQFLIFPFSSLTQDIRATTLPILAGNNLSRSYMPHSGQLTSLTIVIVNNTNPEDTLQAVYINGIASLLTLTVPALSTGTFTSTVSVNISRGDYVDIRGSSVGGSGNVTSSQVSCNFIADPPGNLGDFTTNNSTNNYNNVSLYGTGAVGRLTIDGTSHFSLLKATSYAPSSNPSSQSYLPFTGIVDNFYVYVSSNGFGNPVELTLMVDGVDTVISFTIPPETTGLFSNTVDSVLIPMNPSYTQIRFDHTTPDPNTASIRIDCINFRLRQKP